MGWLWPLAGLAGARGASKRQPAQQPPLPRPLLPWLQNHAPLHAQDKSYKAAQEEQKRIIAEHGSELSYDALEKMDVGGPGWPGCCWR